MSARTQVTMSTTWGGTLCVYNAGDGILSGPAFPCTLDKTSGNGKTVSLAALGCSASLDDQETNKLGPAETEAPERPPGQAVEVAVHPVAAMEEVLSRWPAGTAIV